MNLEHVNVGASVSARGGQPEEDDGGSGCESVSTSFSGSEYSE